MEYRDRPFLDQFKSNLTRLFEVYAAATGRRLSNISATVANDSKFATTFQHRDMRVGTYDLVTSRFSAIWPADVPWPDGIERPAPAPMEEIPMRAQPRAADADPTSDWPADKPWPADIPRPIASPKQPVSGPGA